MKTSENQSEESVIRFEKMPVFKIVRLCGVRGVEGRLSGKRLSGKGAKNKRKQRKTKENKDDGD